MKIKLNGQECEAQTGESILDLCRRENVPIPTLCYHQAFGGQGSCRMCMVEVTGPGEKEARLVAACTYPINSSVEIITESEHIRRIRSTIIMLLARRASGHPLMEKMAEKYNSNRLSEITVRPPNCILCGLCVHACEKMGKSAIWSMFRGVDKRIATPYDEAADDCIGCAACARVCPTQAIIYVEDGPVRMIWNKEFAMAACKRCGKFYATQEELAYLQGRGDYGQDDLCESCRKKTLAANMRDFT